MGGDSYRMCRPVRIGETQLVKKLSKLEDELYVVVIACAAAKQDSVLKKVAKYNQKCDDRILTAWVAK